MKLWCQRWRLLFRKTYDPSLILLGDSLHILAILSQPEGIPWSTSSLIHRLSGFFHGHLFYNAWRGQSHKIGETWPGFTNSTPFFVMGMAHFCIAIDGAFSWKIGSSQPLFNIFWSLNVRVEPRVGDICFFSSVAFHFTTWWASWSHDSSDNPASRPVYLWYVRYGR